MTIPKKSLGQHWLFDDSSLSAMCAAAELSIQDVVLEIGPGLGSLTSKLLDEVSQVIAVEFDNQLATNLVKNISRLKPKNDWQEKLQIINSDILKLDLTNIQPGYKVVANIPYYLTSNLLRLLCESSNPPSLIVLLTQKEVAERVCAGSGQMSLLSCSVQFYCETSLGRLVQSKLFTPPPKVDSQILIMKYLGPKFPDINVNNYFRLIKAGFSEKRKKIRSSLSGGLGLPKDEIDQLLIRSSISGDLRAQNLNLYDWLQIYNCL